MRRLALVVLAVLLAGPLVSCRVATAGSRCRGTAPARDSRYVLVCRNGRWMRTITLARAGQVLAELRAASSPPAVPSTPVAPGALAPIGPGAVFEVLDVVLADQQPDPGRPAAIGHELSIVGDWYASQTGGGRPRFETGPNGGILVRTVRVGLTRAQLERADSPAFELQQALAGAGIPARNHRSVAYVDSGGDACGATLPTGTISALFLAQCNTYPTTTTEWRYGATYLAAHEIAHAMGGVGDCAPHSTFDGHVGDDPRDLLYAGTAERDWSELLLDPGHDDYYATGRTDCPDIANSPLWGG